MGKPIIFRAWDGTKMIQPNSIGWFVEFDGEVWENPELIPS